VRAESAGPRAEGGGPRSALKGSTLVELIIVLTVLGIAAGVVGVAIGALPSPATVSESAAAIAGARRQALATGRAVTITLEDSTGLHAATALPDGSVIADSTILDRLTGRPAQ
jgi:type II secretory pathway pseudopilin PulG